MTVMRLLAILIICAAMALGPTSAIADDPEGVVLRVAQSNDGTTLSQAVEQVRSQTGGRILSAETKVQGNREVHHIKVLTKDGKVKTHKVQGRRLRG
jgi:uncharacterized membrane protein YkoI